MAPGAAARPGRVPQGADRLGPGPGRGPQPAGLAAAGYGRALRCIGSGADLKITLKNDKLAIAGKVQIPRGDITVRELPPSTVKVSDDTVIVGSQTEEGKPPMAMAMDIDVAVAKNGSISLAWPYRQGAGPCAYRRQLDTRGELWLNDGRYRAYGQRPRCASCAPAVRRSSGSAVSGYRAIRKTMMWSPVSA